MTIRSYDTPARDRRAAQTRDAILAALADVVADHGVAELSIQQVADRAGVSHRTVYRHFPDRQALLDTLGAWVEDRMRPALDGRDVSDAEGTLAAVPWVFERFDEHAAEASAMARISVAENVRTRDHDARTAAFRDQFAPRLAPLGDDAEAVAALVRHLISPLTWWVAREEFGLDGAAAGRAVGTVVDAVLAEAGRRARADGTAEGRPGRTR